MSSDEGNQPTFASTVGSRGSKRAAARSRIIAVPPGIDRLPAGPFNLRDEAKLFWRVLRAACRERVILLFSTRGRLKPELLAAVVVGLWPRQLKPKILMYGPMFAPDSGLRGVIERILIKLADRGVFRFVTYSRGEGAVFAQLWNVDPSKIRIVPVVFNPYKKYPEASEIVARRIFAGGDSLRDYEPLVAAARELPDCEFVFATKLLSGRQDLPPNVRAGRLPREQFYQEMASAAIVAIPLKIGMLRGAGHMTYQAAMWARKPTIVTDALGVHDYINDRETGFVVDGSPEAYVRTIRWILDPRNQEQVRLMCDRAHEVVGERFSPDGFATEMLAIVDEAFGSIGAVS